MTHTHTHTRACAHTHIQTCTHIFVFYKQNIPKNKKGKPKMNEKYNVIDDIPMDIVELLARNQHDRQ